MDDLPANWKRGVSLASFCTLGVGGEAAFFCKAHTPDEVQEALLFCHHHHLPFMALGKGSNVLFDPRGFKGLILLNQVAHFKQSGTCFKVGAGYSFARLGVKTARLGFSGLEFAAGIPASCGGAIFMNAGACGQETCDHLVEVVSINGKGEKRVYSKDELHFGYRTSSFHQKKEVIVEGTFNLEPSKDARQRQKELVEARLRTQPYKDKSAGCAFRNPKGSKAAAYWIEKSGLKGFCIGGAAVSKMHANFIVNQGEAKPEEVAALIKYVQDKVYQVHNVVLEQEIKAIPYEP